jgi:hypothetical protein
LPRNLSEFERWLNGIDEHTGSEDPDLADELDYSTKPAHGPSPIECLAELADLL